MSMISLSPLLSILCATLKLGKEPNSLEYVEFYGINPKIDDDPQLYFYNIYLPNATGYEDSGLIADYDVASSIFIPKNTSSLHGDPLVWTVSTYPDLTEYAECVIVSWKENVAFQLDRVDYVGDGTEPTITPLLKARHEVGAGLHVYQIDPIVIEGGYYDTESSASFVLSPLDADANLVDVRLLRTCEQPTNHAYSVWASSFQDLRHVPANTLDGNPKTRWSAEGDQWVAYSLLTGTYEGIGIQWHLGTTRTAFFDVEMSFDGETWYPALIGGESRGTNQIEWYNFPQAVYGSYMRIVGHGNSVNKWNSILEVQFGNPTVNVASK